MPAPISRQWTIQDYNVDPNGGMVGFNLYEDSEGEVKLNETTIWDVVDALVSLELVSTSATVHVTRGPWQEAVTRPTEE